MGISGLLWVRISTLYCALRTPARAEGITGLVRSRKGPTGGSSLDRQIPRAGEAQRE